MVDRTSQSHARKILCTIGRKTLDMLQSDGLTIGKNSNALCRPSSSNGTQLHIAPVLALSATELIRLAEFADHPGQPTEPSRLTANSLCASTANSIGSSFKTSLQNPLTIRFTASSSDSPRVRQ